MKRFKGPSVIILSISQDKDFPDTYHVISALKRRGIEVFKFNYDEYPQKNWAQITFNNADHDVYIANDTTRIFRNQIRGVWHRRRLWIPDDMSIQDNNERIFATNERIKFVNGLFEILPDAIWINPPTFARQANNKAYQLFTAQNIIYRSKQRMVKIPKTLMTSDPKEAKKFWKECKNNMIFKTFFPMPRQSPIQPLTTQIDKNLVTKLTLLQNAPGILQEMLPKKVDLRITVIGEQVFPCAIYSQESSNKRVKMDFRLGGHELRHEVWNLDPLVEKFCIDLTKKLGLVYGAIDMVVTPNGDHYFLEINEMGQWLWIEKRLPNLRITDALVDTLTR